MECSHAQQEMFKRMYCHDHLEYTIEQAIHQMDAERIDMAVNQVQRTIKKNKER